MIRRHAGQKRYWNHYPYKISVGYNIMEECLSEILRNYDISKGYDPYIIKQVSDELFDFLIEAYDHDELTASEIQDMTNSCETLVRETISSLFTADKESMIHEDNTCADEIEMSLKRISSYTGDTQRTREWFERRHQMLTASIAGAILKVDIPNKKGMAIIRDKVTPMIQPETSPDTKQITIVNIPKNPEQASVRGNRYEPIIREAYARLLPDTDPTDAVLEYDCVPHEKYSFLGASPDGIVVKGPMRGRMIEIKCPLPGSIDKDGNTVRHEYWCQMQLQMEVCNLPFCDYVRAVVWDAETARDGYELLNKKRKQYLSGCINPEVGEKDSQIMIMGTVWMDSETGKYVYEKYGKFTRNSEIYQRPNCYPAFIRHYFILARDWMVVRVERNREWFNDTFLPKATEVWEEVLRGRENPDTWLQAHPKREVKTKKIERGEFEYTTDTPMFFDSD